MTRALALNVDKRRSLRLVTASAAGVLCVLVMAALLSPSRLVIVASRVDLGELIVGLRSEHEIFLRNLHPFRAVRVRSVETTCGCVRIESACESIPPLGKGTIVVSACPDASTSQVSSRITAHLDGQDIHMNVRGGVLPVMNGWPQKAIASLDRGDCVISFDPAYRNRLGTIKGFADRDEKELPLRVDASEGQAILTGVEPTDRLELLLIIDGDLPLRWAGPIEFVSR